jgi:hypothetical protein
MYLKGGIAVDSWAKIDYGCDITHEIIGEELHLTFGSGRGPSLALIITDDILDRVTEILTKARTTFQEPDPED